MILFENDEVKISSVTNTVTIFFKKEKRLMICENKYLVHLDKLVAAPQIQEYLGG